MTHLGSRFLWVVLIVIAGLVPAAAAPSGFGGAWTGIDIDGSNVQLVVAGNGSNVRVIYFDDAATIACPDGDGGGYPAMFRTTGRIVGDTLTLGAFDVICLSRPRYVGQSIGAGATLTYNPLDDTITDFIDVVYKRRGAG